MLTLFNSFTVPDVPNVQIYRDDEKRHKFYMVSERASIARDDDDKPIFTFILYARDLDRLATGDLEVERGYLQVTTRAGVSRAQEDKIRAYLKQKLADEQRGGWWFLSLPFVQQEPELGYPPIWLSGTVQFSAVTPSMVIYTAGSKEPSLIDSNLASFSADLNQDGAELFRQALEKGNVLAGVQYQLKFAARIPAIKIIIDGDRGEFYKEVKNYIHKRYESHHSSSVFGITYYSRSYVHEWDELSSITKFRNTFHNLTITVDDSSLPGTEQDAQKDDLEKMAFEIFQTNVLPTFFQPALQDVAKEVENPATAIPINTETTGRIHMEITRSQLVEKAVNPSVQFSQAITPDEVKALTSYLNLSNTFFQELDVTVNANVNFAEDPVYALKVFMEYDQQDDVRGIHVKKAKEFLFKTADQAGRFRQVMAKASDGAPKDRYRYWSEISYKDTGETIRVPATGANDSNERQLVISYRRLGFVKVNLMLGSMPDNVKAVQVAMTYPGYNGPSAQQTFELTQNKPTATFFTYTGKPGGSAASDPGPYHYQPSFILTDGQRMDLPEQSGQAENLSITNPFEQTITTRFMAQADFDVVEKIEVNARYRDAAHDFSAEHHAEYTKNGESSAWALGLRDPDKRDFVYDVLILYKNGARSDQKDKAGELGASLACGEGAVDALEVSVIPSTTDWTKYKLVLVYLRYQDAANQIDEQVNYTFKPDAQADQTWKVLLRNAQMRGYSYRIRYVAANAADNHEIAWTPTDDPILVVP
jgi:hypothetical protein